MARLTREQWLAGAFRVLAEAGPEAMGIAKLSRALGVTKGSFYWHFDDRQALIDAMLESWEAHGTAAIIDVVNDTSPDPGEKLHRLAEIIFGDIEIYASVEANLRVLARGNTAALATVERVDSQRIGYVTDLLLAFGIFRDVAADRAAIFYRTLLGDFVWKQGGGEALTDRARTRLVDLLVS